MEIVLSGFVGAVIGSLITLAGAFGLSALQRRREEKGVARALYMEVVFNRVELDRMAKGDPPLTNLSRATWDASQPVVAMRLKPGDFRRVAFAYELFNACQGSIEIARASGRPTTDDLKLWGGSTKRFLVATSILERHGWSPAQYKDLATEP